MHWLIRRSVESFLRDTYGDAVWQSLWRSSDGAAAFLSNDWHGRNMITDAARHLNKTVEDLLDDLGAWIARQEHTRRLLRFSGRNFGEFLENLELLPDRVRMVVPDLAVPRMIITGSGPDFLQLSLDEEYPEWTFAIAGLIRTMADDYGVLGLIYVKDGMVCVRVCDGSFREKRGFKLIWDDAGYGARRA